jgi:two-component system chemotaxis sensor kinase CheA
MANPFTDPEMAEIFESFLVESQELLESLSQDLMTIESTPDDLDLINRIFRSFHTVKGTSSFMGFTDISGITHEAEDLLNKLRRSELTINQDIIDVLLDVTDWIEKLLEKIQRLDTSPVDYSETVAKIILLRDGKSSVPIVEASPEIETKKSKKTKKGKNALDEVLNSKEIISGNEDFSEDELALIQEAFAEMNANFSNEVSNTNTQIISPKVESNSKPIEIPIITNTIVPPLASNSENDPNKAGAKANGHQETIRVDVNRVEILMDLSGELVLGRNRLSQITDQLTYQIENKEILKDLIENAAQLDFVTSEIQTAVMKMRMVQIGKLYQKAPRIVRDLAKASQKQIQLVVKGEETEIDRGIIEELNDPLVHMIRNSCDHGIESPEVRKSNGKPAIGTITLDAEQEGNHIVLRISDDGAGMDPAKLKAKALERGIITEEIASSMSDNEAYQLIFLPGFSMAVKVSSVSGRGVGMDVVKTNIQNLKGFVEIDSTLGKGSTFIIKLPLTLAIIQGLLVKVHNESYAIPLNSVEEVVSVSDEIIKTVNQQEVINIRNQVFPVIRLDKALNLPILDTTLENKYVVIVALGIQRVGLVVDELLGQQEIVIKSLGEYLGSIHAIAGSTILGDGRVIMIVDIATIIKDAVVLNKYQKVY